MPKAAARKEVRSILVAIKILGAQLFDRRSAIEPDIECEHVGPFAEIRQELADAPIAAGCEGVRDIFTEAPPAIGENPRPRHR